MEPQTQIVPALLDDLRSFGDRSSSMITCYPGFESFHSRTQGAAGQIRYVSTRGAWVAANEPLAALEDRTQVLESFASRARIEGRRAVQVPVSRELAQAAVARGFHAIQVGSEAVFDLNRYFSGPDPLQRFAHARMLLKRGAQVVQLDPLALTAEQEAGIRELTLGWKAGKGKLSLGFLSQVDPLRFKEHKKLFAVFLKGRMLAFLSAAPIYPSRSYFFADYIRAFESRAGTMDLLFIETMRELAAEGVQCVRLGLCPFARLERPGHAAPWMEKLLVRGMEILFRRAKFPMRFESIYRFKSKFDPTSWEPLYLLSSSPIGLRTVIDLARAHLPEGLRKSWFKMLIPDWSSVFRDDVGIKTVPTSFAEFARRSPVTLTVFALCLVFASLKAGWLPFSDLFSASGYRPAQVTALGVWIGPLFHNNAYHLWGDLSSLLFFGVLVEVLMGRAITIAVIALGLWASNPLTHLLVASIAPAFSPSAWSTFLAEVDVGSSNAVYALVGALGAIMRKPKILLISFTLNGIFLCVGRDSILSLHHLIGLGMGYVLLRMLSAKGRRSRHFARAARESGPQG